MIYLSCKSCPRSVGCAPNASFGTEYILPFKCHIKGDWLTGQATRVHRPTMHLKSDISAVVLFGDMDSRFQLGKTAETMCPLVTIHSHERPHPPLHPTGCQLWARLCHNSMKWVRFLPPFYRWEKPKLAEVKSFGEDHTAHAQEAFWERVLDPPGKLYK